jgi:hypothetical protein
MKTWKKEELLKYKGKVIWFTYISNSTSIKKYGLVDEVHDNFVIIRFINSNKPFLIEFSDLTGIELIGEKGIGIEARVVLCRPNAHPRMLILIRRKNVEISMFFGLTEWTKFLDMMKSVVEEYQKLKDQRRCQVSEKDLRSCERITDWNGITVNLNTVTKIKEKV